MCPFSNLVDEMVAIKDGKSYCCVFEQDVILLMGIHPIMGFNHSPYGYSVNNNGIPHIKVNIRVLPAKWAREIKNWLSHSTGVMNLYHLSGPCGPNP